MKTPLINWRGGYLPVMRNVHIPLHAWTGGDLPDSYWNMPKLYRRMVSMHFRDSVLHCKWWIYTKNEFNLFRVLWRRAKLDAWRARSDWKDKERRAEERKLSEKMAPYLRIRFNLENVSVEQDGDYIVVTADGIGSLHLAIDELPEDTQKLFE